MDTIYVTAQFYPTFMQQLWVVLSLAGIGVWTYMGFMLAAEKRRTWPIWLTIAALFAVWPVVMIGSMPVFKYWGM